MRVFVRSLVLLQKQKKPWLVAALNVCLYVIKPSKALLNCTSHLSAPAPPSHRLTCASVASRSSSASLSMVQNSKCCGMALRIISRSCGSGTLLGVRRLNTTAPAACRRSDASHTHDRCQLAYASWRLQREGTSHIMSLNQQM